MITIPPDVVQMTATITGLQLNPIYGPDGTLRTIRVVAMAAGTPPIPVPQWAQPNRRQPTPAEMAAINATPLNPGELVIPTWLERASATYMTTVYGDLINPPAGQKAPREVQPQGPRGPQQRPHPAGRPVARAPMQGQPHPVAAGPVPHPGVPAQRPVPPPAQHPGQPCPPIHGQGQPPPGTPPHP
jgi:hypothetical protein